MAAKIFKGTQKALGEESEIFSPIPVLDYSGEDEKISCAHLVDILIRL
jgi:hypothetical protein